LSGIAIVSNQAHAHRQQSLVVALGIQQFKRIAHLLCNSGSHVNVDAGYASAVRSTEAVNNEELLESSLDWFGDFSHHGNDATNDNSPMLN
jgi:hypothetical protein